ncbi:helicase BlpT [Streptococcus pacificus]|uniref:Helicase BlpT n=1 Tax=Streptococcus pacificus TaxID=2740577 RepID=A0ABS0ZJ55_9STRE|nr:helicase BlpT [Streptococcus pacificus]MBJ8326051.1 helicase BlpT [Streptococcus pacificus]
MTTFTKDTLKEASTLINDLNQKFQNSKKGLGDEQRFQNNIDDMMRTIEKTKKINNVILLELEKFHQRASLLVGIGQLKLETDAYQAWKAYDRFHFEDIKPNLKLYGPIAMM